MALSAEYFEKLRILLGGSDFESIQQGLALIEALDISESDFITLISMIGNSEVDLQPNQRILEEKFTFLHYHDARKLAIWVLYTWIRVVPHRSVDVPTLSIFQIPYHELPEDFSHFGHLREVNMRYGEWVEFPKWLLCMTKLESLDISDNFISFIPDLRHMKHLRTLNISGMKLCEIPDWVGDLPALTSLYVRNNRCTALPDNIAKLTQLTNLDIADNALTSISSIPELTSLTHLNVSNNALKNLPPSLLL